MERDWRLETLETNRHLRGVTLRYQAYRLYRPGWDHDHCEGCMSRLTPWGTPNEDGLHEGYATTEDYVHGPEYAWVCAECFTLFSEEMGWQLKG